jgi:hypothetical protein
VWNRAGQLPTMARTTGSSTQSMRSLVPAPAHRVIRERVGALPQT